jgi:hypothetical protein
MTRMDVLFIIELFVIFIAIHLDESPRTYYRAIFLVITSVNSFPHLKRIRVFVFQILRPEFVVIESILVPNIILTLQIIIIIFNSKLNLRKKKFVQDTQK